MAGRCWSSKTPASASPPINWKRFSSCTSRPDPEEAASASPWCIESSSFTAAKSRSNRPWVEARPFASGCPMPKHFRLRLAGALALDPRSRARRPPCATAQARPEIAQPLRIPEPPPRAAIDPVDLPTLASDSVGGRQRPAGAGRCAPPAPSAHGAACGDVDSPFAAPPVAAGPPVARAAADGSRHSTDPRVAAGRSRGRRATSLREVTEMMDRTIKEAGGARSSQAERRQAGGLRCRAPFSHAGPGRGEGQQPDARGERRRKSRNARRRYRCCDRSISRLSTGNCRLGLSTTPLHPHRC